ILLRKPGHCRRVRVLGLQPIQRAAGAIRRALTLRHNPFKAHPASVLEHVHAVRMLQMLVQPQAGTRTSQQALERGLPCLQRLAAQVITVEFDKVEGIEEDGVVVALVSNAVEHSDTVISAGHRLTVEDTRARTEAGESIRDQWEALSEI